MAALAPMIPYLLAGSAVLGAVSAIRQGQATAASADFNAKVARQNQQIVDSQGNSALETQQRGAARQIGAATAAYGASGVQLSEGSPMDVLEESARNSALDAATLKYNYRLKGLGLDNQARLYTAQAGFARSASYLSAAGGLMSAGASGGTKFGGSAGGGMQAGDLGQD